MMWRQTIWAFFSFKEHEQYYLCRRHKDSTLIVFMTKTLMKEQPVIVKCVCTPNGFMEDLKRGRYSWSGLQKLARDRDGGGLSFVAYTLTRCEKGIDDDANDDDGTARLFNFRDQFEFAI